MKQIFVYTIFFLFCFAYFETKSQTDPSNKIIWSKKSKRDKRKVISAVLSADEKNVFLLKQNSDSEENSFRYKIEKFNSDFKLTDELEISNIINKSGKSIEAFFEFNNSIYTICLNKKTKNRSKGLWILKLDKKNLTIGRRGIKLNEIPTENFRNDLNINLRSSNDETKLLIVYNYPNKNNVSDKVGLIVVNENEEVIYNDVQVLPFKDKKLDIFDFAISNNGEIALIADFFEREKMKNIKKGSPNFKSFLFYIYNELKTVEIPHKQRLISDLKLRFDHQNKILISGFYSNKYLDNQNGIISYKYNRDQNDFDYINLHNFKDSYVIEGILKDNVPKILNPKNDFYLNNYELSEIILSPDNGFLLISEKSFIIKWEENNIITYKKHQVNAYDENVEFYYNDIFIYKFDHTGKLTWYSTLPKKQTTYNDLGVYSSYNYFEVNNKFYLLYNDHPKNFDLDFNYNNPVDLTVNKKMNTILVEIKDDGILAKRLLCNAKEAEVYIMPLISRDINNEKIIIYGYKSKFERIGVLNFEN